MYTEQLIICAAVLTAVFFIGISLLISLFVKKVPFHTILHIVLRTLIIPLSGASLILTVLNAAEMVDTASIWALFLGNEKVCCVLASFAYLSVFALIVRNLKLPAKIVLSVPAAALYTVRYFLLNNVIHTLTFPVEISGTNDFLSDYLYFMRYDLNYRYGLGIFRYVLVFAVQLALFGLVILFQSEKGRGFLRTVFSKPAEIIGIVSNRFLFRSEFIKLTELFVDAKIGFTAIAEYLDDTEHDVYLMHDMMYCITKFGIPIYSDLLFSLFGNVLTEKQYIKYREDFLSRYDYPLCTACEILDKKIGLEYDDEYRDPVYSDKGEIVMGGEKNRSVGKGEVQ